MLRNLELQDDVSLKFSTKNLYDGPFRVGHIDNNFFIWQYFSLKKFDNCNNAIIGLVNHSSPSEQVIFDFVPTCSHTIDTHLQLIQYDHRFGEPFSSFRTGYIRFCSYL